MILTPAFAMGAEGARVDLFDDNGDRRYEWKLTWANMADLVGEGCDKPVARAGPYGVEFIALDKHGSTLVKHWSWESLAKRAMLSASPIKGQP